VKLEYRNTWLKIDASEELEKWPYIPSYIVIDMGPERDVGHSPLALPHT
jgi:hypothetical protein